MKEGNAMSCNINLKDPEYKDTTSWNRWGLIPHTEEEIREKFLTDPDNICICFLQDYSRVSKEFLEEEKVLSILNPITKKPFINKSNYNYYIDDLKKLYSNIRKGTKYKTREDTRKLITNYDVLESNYDDALKEYKKYESINDIYIKAGYDTSNDAKKRRKYEINQNKLISAKSRLEKEENVMNETGDFIDKGVIDKDSDFYNTYLKVYICDRFTFKKEKPTKYSNMS